MKTLVWLLVVSTCSAVLSVEVPLYEECPKNADPPMKSLLCYYEGVASVEKVNPCLCTHIVYSSAARISDNYTLHVDQDLERTSYVLRKRNPSLRLIISVSGDAQQSDALVKSAQKRKEFAKSAGDYVQEAEVDGLEFNFRWSTSGGAQSKEGFTELVKLLREKMNAVHSDVKSREKRDYGVNEEQKDDNTTQGTLLRRNRTATRKTASNKSESRRKSRIVQRDSESKSKTLILRVPVEPEIIAKRFDLKHISKHVDLFVVNTHNMTDSSESGVTYHPSRLMGLADILNMDSILDLLTGLGAPHTKLVVSLPAAATKFTLSDVTKNTPRSPVKQAPQQIGQGELCSLMSKGSWMVERDEDLTAPYAYQNNTWVAFEDKISAGIKGKYVILRDLGGAAIYQLDDEDSSGVCKSLNNNTDNSVLGSLYYTFTNLARKSRGALLETLEEDIKASTLITYSGDVHLSPYRIVRVIDNTGAVHVVRKEAKTQFECSRQGYYVHPSGCNRFYRCVKFNQYTPDYTVFEYDCPAGLAFDERWEVCVWPGSLPEGSPCTGSSEIAPVPRARYSCPTHEGYFADPENCRWFFACLDHARDGSPLTAYEFRCPFGLVFDGEKLLCDWPWLVPGCGAAGGAVFVGQTGFGFGAHASRASGVEFGASGAAHGAGSYSSQTSGASRLAAGSGYIATANAGSYYEGRDTAAYATFPDSLVSGGRIANSGGVVLSQYVSGGGLLGVQGYAASTQGQGYAASGQGYASSGQGYGISGQGYLSSGQGHVVSGQGLGASGQGFGASGQGYTTAGQGYTTAGQGYAASGQGYAGSGRGYAASGQGYAASGQGYAGSGRGYAASGQGYVASSQSYDAAARGYTGSAFVSGSAQAQNTARVLAESARANGAFSSGYVKSVPVVTPIVQTATVAPVSTVTATSYRQGGLNVVSQNIDGVSIHSPSVSFSQPIVPVAKHDTIVITQSTPVPNVAVYGPPAVQTIVKQPEVRVHQPLVSVSYKQPLQQVIPLVQQEAVSYNQQVVQPVVKQPVVTYPQSVVEQPTVFVSQRARRPIVKQEFVSIQQPVVPVVRQQPVFVSTPRPVISQQFVVQPVARQQVFVSTPRPAVAEQVVVQQPVVPVVKQQLFVSSPRPVLDRVFVQQPVVPVVRQQPVFVSTPRPVVSEQVVVQQPVVPFVKQQPTVFVSQPRKRPSHSYQQVEIKSPVVPIVDQPAPFITQYTPRPIVKQDFVSYQQPLQRVEVQQPTIGVSQPVFTEVVNKPTVYVQSTPRPTVYYSQSTPAPIVQQVVPLQQQVVQPVVVNRPTAYFTQSTVAPASRQDFVSLHSRTQQVVAKEPVTYFAQSTPAPVSYSTPIVAPIPQVSSAQISGYSYRKPEVAFEQTYARQEFPSSTAVPFISVQSTTTVPLTKVTNYQSGSFEHRAHVSVDDNGQSGHVYIQQQPQLVEVSSPQPTVTLSQPRVETFVPRRRKPVQIYSTATPVVVSQQQEFVSVSTPQPQPTIALQQFEINTPRRKIPVAVSPPVENIYVSQEPQFVHVSTPQPQVIVSEQPRVSFAPRRKLPVQVNFVTPQTPQVVQLSTPLPPVAVSGQTFETFGARKDIRVNVPAANVYVAQQPEFVQVSTPQPAVAVGQAYQTFQSSGIVDDYIRLSGRPKANVNVAAPVLKEYAVPVAPILKEYAVPAAPIVNEYVAPAIVSQGGNLPFTSYDSRYSNKTVASFVNEGFASIGIQNTGGVEYYNEGNVQQENIEVVAPVLTRRPAVKYAAPVGIGIQNTGGVEYYNEGNVQQENIEVVAPVVTRRPAVQYAAPVGTGIQNTGGVEYYNEGNVQQENIEVVAPVVTRRPAVQYAAPVGIGIQNTGGVEYYNEGNVEQGNINVVASVVTRRPALKYAAPVGIGIQNTGGVEYYNEEQENIEVVAPVVTRRPAVKYAAPVVNQYLIETSPPRKLFTPAHRAEVVDEVRIVATTFAPEITKAYISPPQPTVVVQPTTLRYRKPVARKQRPRVQVQSIYEKDENIDVLLDQYSGKYGGVLNNDNDGFITGVIAGDLAGVKKVSTTTQGYVEVTTFRPRSKTSRKRPTTTTARYDDDDDDNSSEEESNEKQPIVVVTRLSDTNPILIAKLGAKCTCQSNREKMRSKSRSRGSSRGSNGNGNSRDYDRADLQGYDYYPGSDEVYDQDAGLGNFGSRFGQTPTSTLVPIVDANNGNVPVIKIRPNKRPTLYQVPIQTGIDELVSTTLKPEINVKIEVDPTIADLENRYIKNGLRNPGRQGFLRPELPVTIATPLASVKDSGSISGEVIYDFPSSTLQPIIVSEQPSIVPVSYVPTRTSAYGGPYDGSSSNVLNENPLLSFGSRDGAALKSSRRRPASSRRGPTNDDGVLVDVGGAGIIGGVGGAGIIEGVGGAGITGGVGGAGEAVKYAGRSFDRYGPGGWRSIDETLQGSVDCQRQGLFRHPKYCNKFYACNWDQWKKRFTLHVFNCPVHLAYDTSLGACNWPTKGPACADDNLLL